MSNIKIETLQEFFKNKDKYLVNTIQGDTIVDLDEEGHKVEYNEIFKFYKHPEFPPSIFFRETWVTNSYCWNQAIESFELVEGREKTITVYEPINQ